MKIIAAPVAGFLLGALDFVWIKYVPFPFGGLGNSIAVWAVAAFLFTFLRRERLPRSVAGAVVMLLVAVPSYYAAAAVIQNDDWKNLWAPYSLLWMGLGVIAGIVFGAAGVVAREPGRGKAPAAAVPVAVLLAEAVLQLMRTGDSDAGPYAAVLITCAVLLTLVVARSRRARGLTLAYCVPVTAGGYLLLLAAGFR